MIDAMTSMLAFLITATAFCIYIHVIPKWIRRQKEKTAISVVADWLSEQGYRSISPAYSIISVNCSGPTYKMCSWYVWVDIGYSYSGNRFSESKIYKFTLRPDFFISEIREYQVVKKDIADERWIKDKEAVVAVRNWFRERKVPDDGISLINLDCCYEGICENPTWHVGVYYDLSICNPHPSMHGPVIYKFTLDHDFSIDKIETNIDIPEQDVYIITSGKKYHLADCYHSKNGATPITKQEAIAEGYTPCSVCKP